ncbi:MAG TPA: hypothetical protein VL325_05200 [Pyrinomonadaceae bacterium]|jgi:hypothetical protein|nr:hypothetical protein [Pyrinomonadaceae bacterium]
MNQVKTAVILALFLAVLISAGCGPPSSSNAVNSAANESSKNTETANSDIEGLRQTIAMPFEPEDAVWRGGADEKKLIAVLRFSTADADKITEEAKKIKPPTAAKIGSELWFPAELIAQADNSGDDTLNGTTYAANAFFQPPFTDGKLTRIEGADYFVLELTAQ